MSKKLIPLQLKLIIQIMNKQFVILSLATAALLATSCAQHQYSMADVQRSRIVIDQRYDANPDKEATAFLAPYKQKVDEIMSPVMGVLHAICHDSDQRVLCPIYLPTSLYIAVQGLARNPTLPFTIWEAYAPRLAKAM